MKKTLCILFLLVIFVALVSAEGKYAYKVISRVAVIDLQRTLDSYGAEGYRAVFITILESGFFYLVLEHPY